MLALDSRCIDTRSLVPQSLGMPRNEKHVRIASLLRESIRYAPEYAPVEESVDLLDLDEQS